MNQYSRIPIAAAKHLNGNEYKILDYLLYRNALDDWKFWISDLEANLNVCERHIRRTLKSFLKRNFVTQDKARHYHVNYPTIEAWFNERLKCPLASGYNVRSKAAKMSAIQERERKEVQERIISTPKPTSPSVDDIKKRVQDFAFGLPSTRR